MFSLPESEYAPFYKGYIERINEANVIEAFTSHHEETFELWRQVDESVGEYSYEAGKWNVKQVLQHVIDTERIMAYRALTIAREPGVSLPGFNQDAYADKADVINRTLAELSEEFHIVRQSTIILFGSFSAEDLRQIGHADGKAISVRALGYIIIGHGLHHNQIVLERYIN